jgi:hypothetical protein
MRGCDWRINFNMYDEHQQMIPGSDKKHNKSSWWNQRRPLFHYYEAQLQHYLDTNGGDEEGADLRARLDCKNVYEGCRTERDQRPLLSSVASAFRSKLAEEHGVVFSRGKPCSEHVNFLKTPRFQKHKDLFQTVVVNLQKEDAKRKRDKSRKLREDNPNTLPYWIVFMKKLVDKKSIHDQYLSVEERNATTIMSKKNEKAAAYLKAAYKAKLIDRHANPIPQQPQQQEQQEQQQHQT